MAVRFVSTQTTDFAHIETLIQHAHGVVEDAILEAQLDGCRVTGIVSLFSGGNDSTTVGHMFKDISTHAAHANTGIGIEKTRQYVRDTCASWELPLYEFYPDSGYGYRDFVLGRARAKAGPNKGELLYPGGFPGPGAHFLMFQRLKERALDKVRRELVKNPSKERVIFLAGRRHSESKRRKKLEKRYPIEKRGSTLWVSPILNWSKLDLNDYRKLYPDVPRNEVSDILHMSGECLCGSFAHEGELAEIEFWFPEVAQHIRDLEAEVTALGTIPPERCKWGWGYGKEEPSEVGIMCDSCDARFNPKDHVHDS